MEIGTADTLGILLYFILVGIFAYLTRRTRTFSEYAVGGRKVPSLMIFSSLAATYIGPGFSVGFTGKAYQTGYTFYILSATYALQTILVGLFFAPKLASNHRDCHTIGDVMGKLYGKTTHFLAGIVSVGLCIGFTAVMGKIGGVMLRSITGLPLEASIAIVTFFTAIYTFTGGLRAVVATEAMQFSLFSIIIPAMLLFAVSKLNTSLDEIKYLSLELTKNGMAGLSTMQMVGILVSFLLGETLIPPYANRALAAKTEISTKTGFVAAGCYSLIWLAIVASLGIFAHKFIPANTDPDSVFIKLGRELLPSGVFGLLLAAIIAIVMSSQESVMNSGSVAFVRDIISLKWKLDDNRALVLSRISTLVIAFISVIVAGFSPSIIEGLLICYSIWAPSILIPFLFGLYLKKTTPAAGWLSMTCGGASSIIWQMLLKEPFGIPAILVGMLFAFCGFIIGLSFDDKVKK